MLRLFRKIPADEVGFKKSRKLKRIWPDLLEPGRNATAPSSGSQK